MSTTSVAILRCAIGVNVYSSATSFYRFVADKVDELAPACIRDRFAEAMVVNHAFDIQLLNTDSAVGIHQLLGSLVVEVTALVAYLTMRLSDKYLCLLPTLTTLLLTTKRLLTLGKDSLRLAKVPWVGDRLASRESSKGLKSNVNANSRLSRRNWVRHINDAREGHIPLVGVSTDGYSLDNAYNGTRPLDFDKTDVGDRQTAILSKMPTALLQREAIVSIPTLEAWITRLLPCFHAPEEGLKGFVKAFKGLLKYLRTYYSVLRTVLLDKWQLLHLVIDRDRLANHLVGIASLLQRCVIEFPASVKPPLKFSRLFFGRIETVLVTSSYLHAVLPIVPKRLGLPSLGYGDGTALPAAWMLRVLQVNEWLKTSWIYYTTKSQLYQERRRATSPGYKSEAFAPIICNGEGRFLDGRMSVIASDHDSAGSHRHVRLDARLVVGSA